MNLASIAIRGSSGLELEVSAFISVTGITDSTIISALDNLVKSLKANSHWTRIKALYPFVGGSAASHSYNLKDTSLYQITWGGGLTHDANGVTGNGSSGYGNTGLIPSSVLSTNNTHISAYIRQISTTAKFEIGTKGSVGNYILGMSVVSSQFYTQINDDASSLKYPGGVGYYIASRPNSAGGRDFKNGTLNGGSITGTAGLSNAAVGILAYNNNGSFISNSNANLALVSIGDALASDSAAANLNTIVQAFQTALGRNV